jgi:hypothetical protein
MPMLSAGDYQAALQAMILQTAELRRQIEQAREDENTIDSSYLLDAIEKDLARIQIGNRPYSVAELLANPVS